MIEETFITFVSSLIVEKISVSFLLISPSFPISSSSMSVAEVDLFCPLVLIDFSLYVKAVTLIFISGRGSAISSAKQGKSCSIFNLVKN